MEYKVYYDLKQLINDLPKLKDITIIAPSEFEKMINRLRTYEYKDFIYILQKQNIRISFLKKGEKNEYNKNIKT